ncbi:hypothetical protein MNBD_GAMMA09-3341 [hydrothermal vent metagenome]|uniref:Zinc finger/thioredoxin putative domain-containing protein n=1 Tax=hydrothermal vent metagenome TaxID=652676 RepID=A0A3B0XWJ2_9ZZZZ
MQTECPHCHTVFNVSEDELEQAGGQLRCGHCQAIFTADNPYKLISYPGPEEILGTTDDVTAEPEPVPEARDEAAFNPDNQNSSEHDSTLTLAMGSSLGLDLSTAADAAPDSINNAAEDEQEESKPQVADVIPPELRAESRQSTAHFSHSATLFLTLSILAGIATGIFQYAYYNRDNLIKVSGIRPIYEFSCKLTGCTLPAPKDISLIVLSSKNIFTHPNTENALMVSASIVNQADYEQEYPIIELRFENVRGETIAARRFFADEYLGIPAEEISKMQPETPVNINLEIKDPGSDMVSYEFAFL